MPDGQKPVCAPFLESALFQLVMPFITIMSLVYMSLHGIDCWPDGAPCLENNIQTMYPNAIEHQGGEQAGNSPYEIWTSHKCYRRGDHVMIKIRPKDLNDNREFKGFSVQARVAGTDRQMGKFLRDANGSWRYQCFTNHAAATHSHNTPKSEMEMWWEYDDFASPSEDLQFIATVAESAHHYWARNTRSAVLPPCTRRNEDDRDPMSVIYPQPNLPVLKKLEVHSNVIPMYFAQSSARVVSVARRIDTTFYTTTTYPTTTTTPTTTIYKAFINQIVINNCYDMDVNCGAWKRFCSTSTHVSVNCPKSCNKC